MLTSTLVALAALTAASPALAAPVSPYARSDAGGALTLSSRWCPMIARAGFSSFKCPELEERPINGIYKARGIDDIVVRDDASGALTIPSIFACPIIARAGLSSSACPEERPFNGIFKARGSDDVMARDDNSGAITLPSFLACPIIARAGFSSSACPEERPFNGIYKARRNDVTARDDSSEALSLSTVGTLVSVAAPVIGGIIDHFTNKQPQQQRDYFVEELLARSILDELD
ncbi:hypothetical protein PHLGIDRAFT_119919 [Phlebiopsis gigantea 11061_1 CR5-6]|uniref:Uncharacterized protein n=1 Tax=Phlebiopsis gigantea (strain 11061_1 CR5-6) TaxID=745531 RepID=A0A0C3PHI6_PHLG1|nr:hypothetical protein PHLGIDRAFT_119919 [Phlebiopsis gigantea 11061_1 CR5-6]